MQRTKKTRRFTPEALAGLAFVGGFAAALYLRTQEETCEEAFVVHIPPAKADSVLVLEQVDVDTYIDMDFQEAYRVTPIKRLGG